MTLLLVLDDAHLGNTLFMKAFGHSLASLKRHRLVILHGSERHTEALIQTGMFRSDAAVRAAREINRKLTTWLADHGVSCAGVHGDQRALFTRTEAGLRVDRTRLDTYPTASAWLVSTLAASENGRVSAIPLAEMARFLEIHIPTDHVVVFSLSETDEILNPDNHTILDWSQRIDFIDRIPTEFRNYTHPLILSGAGNLHLIGSGKPVTQIR